MSYPSHTSQSSCPLYGLVDRLETGEQRVVVVGADLVLVDQVPVEVIEFDVSLLHGPPAQEQKQEKTEIRGERERKRDILF